MRKGFAALFIVAGLFTFASTSTSEPIDLSDRYALNVLGLMQYIPAEANSERIPVKVNKTAIFLTEGQECESFG